MPTLAELQEMTARAEKIAHQLDELALFEEKYHGLQLPEFGPKLVGQVISHGINSVRASLINELREMGVEAE